jgi:hypothetical protein
MNDPILKSFLEEQEIEAMELDRDSDILNIAPIGPSPRQRYLVEYNCKGLVRGRTGIAEVNRFIVGIHFPLDYWHRVFPPEVITLLEPRNVWHSNVRGQLVCPGKLVPGTALVDLITQIYSIFTFNNITIREDDTLQPEASSWARRNMHRFPLENRPLRRRRVTLRVKDGPAEGVHGRHEANDVTGGREGRKGYQNEMREGE